MSPRIKKAWGGATDFGLVKMLAAMLIAVIVLAAVGRLYLDSSKAARFHAAVQRVQENGRFAADTMSRSLRMGGYDDPQDALALPAEWIKGTTDSTGTMFSVTGLKRDGDTVGVTFQGGANIHDCQGRAAGSAVFVTSLYGVSTANQLVCASQLSNGATSAPVALAEGVEDMRVLYGLDLESDGIANRYAPAGNVMNWNQVVSIRITLLINSVGEAQPAASNVCLGCVVFPGTRDRLVRGEFETTIGLRNPASTPPAQH